MNTMVVENNVRTNTWRRVPTRPVVEPKQKSFEEACAECNATTVDAFIDELRRRVKEHYQNA